MYFTCYFDLFLHQKLGFPDWKPFFITGLCTRLLAIFFSTKQGIVTRKNKKKVLKNKQQKLYRTLLLIQLTDVNMLLCQLTNKHWLLL